MIQANLPRSTALTTIHEAITVLDIRRIRVISFWSKCVEMVSFIRTCNMRLIDLVRNLINRIDYVYRRISSS